MTLIERLEAGKPEEQKALLRDWLRAVMPPSKPGEWTQEQWAEWLNLTTRIERLFDCGAYLDAVMLLVPADRPIVWVFASTPALAIAAAILKSKRGATMTNNTTTPESVEKVARALCCHEDNSLSAWSDTNLRERVMWRQAAQAAIASLAEHQSAPEQDRPETAVESPAKAQTATNTAGEPVSGKLPTDMPGSVEKVAAKLFDEILGDMSGYDEFGYAPYREDAMRKIIAALADHQGAAVPEDDEGPCTDCWDTGINQNERPCSCQPAPTIEQSSKVADHPRNTNPVDDRETAVGERQTVKVIPQEAFDKLKAVAESEAEPTEALKELMGTPSTDTPDEYLDLAAQAAGFKSDEEARLGYLHSSQHIYALIDAHADTLQKLAVAREALAFYALPSCGGFPDNFAYQALAQIGRADD